MTLQSSSPNILSSLQKSLAQQIGLEPLLESLLLLIVGLYLSSPTSAVIISALPFPLLLAKYAL